MCVSCQVQCTVHRIHSVNIVILLPSVVDYMAYYTYGMYLSIYNGKCFKVQFRSVQSLSRVRLFGTPWTAARQASLSITNSWSSPKLMSIESVMPSNHLILCRPLLLLPSIFPSIKVFSDESALCIRWPKYWSFSSNISPSVVLDMDDDS